MTFWLYFFAVIGFFTIITFFMMMIMFTIFIRKEENADE